MEQCHHAYVYPNQSCVIADKARQGDAVDFFRLFDYIYYLSRNFILYDFSVLSI